MILRKRIGNEWNALSKKDTERWRSFLNRWEEVLLDMDEEGLVKTPQDLYHKMMDAVGDPRGTTDVKTRGADAIKHALHNCKAKDIDTLMAVLTEWYALEETLTDRDKDGEGGGGREGRPHPVGRVLVGSAGRGT